ncbi:MAG: aldehyde dehydrogenase family protein [Candidatus Binatia bacterium]
MASVVVDNPATGETACTVELIASSQLDEVLVRASSGGRDLAAMPLGQRLELCEKAVQEFEAKADTVAADITRQMGKPLGEARSEIATMAARARYMMSIAEDVLGELRLGDGRGVERFVERVPVGVVLDVPAWNYPLLTAVNAVFPAVIAGNAVILKHSSRTPLCGGQFQKAFEEAGAPPHSVIGIATDHANTAALIADERVGYVAFTGSVGGGREVSAAAGGRFIDVGLELGGKDAAYVRPDADLVLAAAGLAEGAFYNAGQSCCGVERVFAHRAVYGRLVDAITEQASSYRPGDPLEPGTSLGPMAQPEAPGLLNAQVEDALGRGGRLTTGGRAVSVGGRGRYFEATVIADATSEMTVMGDESFGPLVAMAPVDSDEEAVGAINDTRYGLTASIWTADREAAINIGRRLEVGTVLVNRCDYLDPALPWSGWKDSGVGITLSRFGFDRMTRTRGYHLRF